MVTGRAMPVRWVGAEALRHAAVLDARLSDAPADRLPREAHLSKDVATTKSSLLSKLYASMSTQPWRPGNKRIELTRPNRDGAYQPHRD